MEIKGRVKVVGDEKQVSATFKTRELVVTTDETYPQHIPIQFNQDKTEYLDVIRIGDTVTVATNCRGREWVSPQGETKYFLSLEGWRITKEAAYQPPSKPAFEPTPDFKEEEHDDLPF